MARELRGVSTGGTFRVDISHGEHSWTLDEPVKDGGTGAGPTPVEAFLGALLSCLTVSFQFHAKRKGVPVDRIEGWVAANDNRYIETIAVELEVWSAAPADEVRALLPAAERGCFVKATLKPEIQYSLELAVYPPEAPAA